MALRKEIDGSKYDIRVLCTGPGDSEDSGYVEGVPIDPPDRNAGWMLVDLWVEHDTQQEQVKGEEKGEKAKVVTRLVNPAFYQLWAKPKSKPKKEKKAKPTTLKADSPKTSSEPKKKRGRQKQFNPQEVVFAADVPKAYKILLCPHTAKMLHDTINSQGAEVSLRDTTVYEPRCHDCKKRDEERDQSEATAGE